jgi:hypothetical protein
MILKSWLDRPSGRRVGELMIITKVTDKRIRATSEIPSLSCKKGLRKPIPRKIREIRKDI